MKRYCIAFQKQWCSLYSMQKQLPHNILEPFLVVSHVANAFWHMHST